SELRPALRRRARGARAGSRRMAGGVARAQRRARRDRWGRLGGGRLVDGARGRRGADAREHLCRRPGRGPPAGARRLGAGGLPGQRVRLRRSRAGAVRDASITINRLPEEHLMNVEDGMSIRREVLGDEHVDRATANATDFTRDFQEFLTRYAWGDIWSRPGLDRRTRSCITLTALVALNHHEELALHVRAALRNGLTADEIKEVLLHAAVYCGLPPANRAFAIADAELKGGH